MRSATGSEARLRTATALLRAPVFLNSSMKKRASSVLMPTPTKTTANSSSEPLTVDCRTTCAAIMLWGSPVPEKMGSFWPRTRV
jgi:hypothetical protein